MKTITLLVLCALPAACTTWSAAALEPQQFKAQKSPEAVRLILNDSTRLTARRPLLTGDSLIWMAAPGKARGDSVRNAVPVSSIRRIEIQKIDGGGTAILLLFLGGAAVGLSALLKPRG